MRLHTGPEALLLVDALRNVAHWRLGEVLLLWVWLLARTSAVVLHVPLLVGRILAGVDVTVISHVRHASCCSQMEGVRLMCGVIV